MQATEQEANLTYEYDPLVFYRFYKDPNLIMRDQGKIVDQNVKVEKKKDARFGFDLLQDLTVMIWLKTHSSLGSVLSFIDCGRSRSIQKFISERSYS